MPEPSRKREHDQLLHALNGARVSEDLTKYLTGLGLSSISDFVGLVTTAGFETELKTQVLDLSPAKDARCPDTDSSQANAEFVSGHAPNIQRRGEP